MNKQIKKILALILVAVMCMGVMSGCVDDTEDSEIIKATVPVVQTDVKNADIYPLDCDKTFTIVCTKGVDDLDSFDCFTLWEEVTGVETDVINMSGESLQLSVTSGDYGDAIFYASGFTKAKWNELGMAGRFVNFMDYIEYMPNFARALNTYPEAIDVIAAPDGGVYSLPRIGTTSTTHPAWYVRTDYLKKAGWDELPATTDELMQCMYDLKTAFADNEDFYPLSANASGSMSWLTANGLVCQLFPAFGELMKTSYYVNPETGKVEFGADTEQYKRVLAYINEIIDKNYLEFGAEIYSEDGTNSRASFLAGNIAMSTLASFMTPDKFPSGELDMTLLPPLTSQWQSERRFDANDRVVWQNNGINALLPEEDIITLVRWFDSMYAFSDNPLNEEGTVYGISFWVGEEGKDFTVDKETMTYTILPHEGYESGALWQSANSMGGSLALYDTEDWLYVQDSNTGLEIKGLGTLNNTLPYAVDIFEVTWLTLTESEAEVYNDTWTNLRLYIDEWTAKFIVGEYDLETQWDEYLSGMESMGSEVLRDLYQVAYDRHIGSKE